MFADIVVDIAAGELDRVFQYRVPLLLESAAVIGARVKIPFGRGNRAVEGYIIDLKEKADYPEAKIKDIQQVFNDGISVEQQLITLAANIKTVYGSTMITALKTVIPVSRQVRPVSKKYYQLALDVSETEKLLEKYQKDQRFQSRVRLIEYLLDESDVQTSERRISREAAVNGLEVSQTILKAMVKDGILIEMSEKIFRRPVKVSAISDGDILLNDQQQAAVDDILSKRGEVHLLHGITGSGKTEVYIELIEAVIREGRQVIVLIPEISLTMQTVSRFYKRFGDRVSVMNSRLSAGERYDQYMRAKEGDIDIVVGPRSALFMPFENLGMIIIDEEHDGAYKSESTPKYHAREVAIWRSRLCGATVVLGSATPSVVSYKKAKDGIYYLHRLTKRAKESSQLPKVSVVDLRQEFKLKNKKIFSGSLLEMTRECLEKKEQAMFFLNRRGFAGFVSCRNCGYVVKCKHCDVSLTAHYDGSLKCHYCGYEQPGLTTCPECGSPYIAAFGTGTQKVEVMVQETFPNARVLRLDRDAASKKHRIDEIISDFKEEKADILVGTQMIVKGHDFPKVTLVGILAADLSMFSGDYMASERTFDLLVQAAGRAGRGQLTGQVVIQTYNPDHYSIQKAAAQDYEGFYEEELIFRQMMHYPPFCHMLAVLGECSDEKQLESAMHMIADLIKKYTQDEEYSEGTEVIGPANAFVAKGKDAYRKVVYVKCQKQKPLIYLKNQIEAVSRENRCFQRVYLQYDMDPVSMY